MVVPSPSIEKWGHWTVAWVQDSTTERALELVRVGKVQGIGISDHRGFSGHDLSFLQAHKYIEGLVLPFASKFDLRHLIGLSHLKFLTLGESRAPLDLGQFSRLIDLRIDWHGKLRLPDEESLLQNLYVSGFKAPTKDLRDFPQYKHLTTIEFVRANFESLDGIERLGALEHAEFHYCRNLRSVRSLKFTGARHLHFGNCRKISDVQELKSCRELTTLRYCACGALPSLSFLNDCAKLQQFTFVNTLVEDGDMTPLLRLKYAGFNSKRHYSHTYEQIQALTQRNREEAED